MGILGKIGKKVVKGSPNLGLPFGLPFCTRYYVMQGSGFRITRSNLTSVIWTVFKPFDKFEKSVIRLDLRSKPKGSPKIPYFRFTYGYCEAVRIVK